jgi:hypothetical protein
MERVDAAVKALASLKSSVEALPGDATPPDPVLKAIAAEIRDATIGFMKRLLLFKKAGSVAGLGPSQASFVQHSSQKERDMIDEICRISSLSKKEVVDSAIGMIAEFDGLLTTTGALLIYIDRKIIRMDTSKYL